MRGKYTPREPHVVFACAHCGVSVETTAAEFRNGHRFCSHSCVAKGRGRPLEERFWARVNKNGPIPAHCPWLGPCWLWTGHLNANGYGVIEADPTDDGQPTRKLVAHRLAWGIATGEMPPAERTVMHACDTPGCVRQDTAGTYTVNGIVLPRFGHLALGTLGLNCNDAKAKGRTATGDKNGSRTHPERYPTGEQRGESVLTEAAVLTIRAAYAQHPDTPGLAARFADCYGVSRQTVQKAARRLTWKHLP